MAELMVFDIQKFALHDGPGIRTTVFLKGCPLDCVWCHNPESKRYTPQLAFLEKNCVSCGSCQTVCRQEVHTVTEKGHVICYDRCISCGECEKTCLNHALKIYGKRMGSEEILETVLRDKDFFIRSGGGLTVSGGEPMLQFDGLFCLLKEAKKKGLHVCLDTCGYADTEKYEKIAPYVDLFLFDYKVTDKEKHKLYTGVDNDIILKNLDHLCRSGNQVYLRCPVIPGINDDDGHFRGIAKLSQKYENIVQVNLMMYHDMAKGKAEQIGEIYKLKDIKTMEENEKKRISERVRSFGCCKLQES